jgi:predicted lipoprotein with Yx(FWY)xxD motif
MRLTTIIVGALALGSATLACSTSGDSAADTAASTSTTMNAAPAGSTAAPASTSGTAAVVKVASDAKNGRYLVDGNGQALYLFEKDEKGESHCDSACAAAWPPYLSQGTPTAGDSAVKSDMLSTIRRKDGSQQVAYDGKPLYHYAKDTGAGSTKGQDIEEFGAEWYLVAPDGRKQEGDDH